MSLEFHLWPNHYYFSSHLIGVYLCGWLAKSIVCTLEFEEADIFVQSHLWISIYIGGGGGKGQKGGENFNHLCIGTLDGAMVQSTRVSRSL